MRSLVIVQNGIIVMPNVVQFNVSVVQTTTLSCIDLTSSVANPVVGQSVTATCYGRFSSTTTSPVAQFGVNLNGTLLGVSGAIPLVAGEARYTTTVPQEGNYLVQCQICTDATLFQIVQPWDKQIKSK